MENLKSQGSDHYKTGSTEPIDLYKSGDMLQDWWSSGCIRRAFRCRKSSNRSKELIISDCNKIIHETKIFMESLGLTQGEKDDLSKL